jgi:hypothetical protein
MMQPLTLMMIEAELYASDNVIKNLHRDDKDNQTFSRKYKS